MASKPDKGEGGQGMKVKIIRALSQNMEQELQKFLDSLLIRSQIVSITVGGNWRNNNLAVLVILYL